MLVQKRQPVVQCFRLQLNPPAWGLCSPSPEARLCRALGSPGRAMDANSRARALASELVALDEDSLFEALKNLTPAELQKLRRLTVAAQVWHMEGGATVLTTLPAGLPTATVRGTGEARPSNSRRGAGEAQGGASRSFPDTEPK